MSAGAAACIARSPSAPVMAHRSRVNRGLRRLWWWLRQLSGDAAYQNYLAAMTRRGEANPASAPPAAAPLLSPEEFYLEQLWQKYAQPSRCC